MSDQDPFGSFGSDRTIVKPSAGRGARPAASAEPRPAMAPDAARDAGLSLDALMTASLNPLVSAASPLLCTAPRLRAMAQHPNPLALKEALADGVRKFEAQARSQGIPNEQVVAARYILCTMIDEAASSTPWGGSGVWAGQSLLVQFHNEASGGEKVFLLMSKLAENVEGNRNLLELIYVALAFGFEGRYRLLPNGRSQLDSVRERLSQMLAQSRGGYEKELSPHWRGADATRTRLRDGLPVWVAGAVAALVLMVVFMGFRFALNGNSNPVFAALSSLDVKAATLPVPVAAPPPPVVPPKPRLAGFLKAEIAANLVAVNDLPDRSVVTIRGDGLFDAGSSEISSKFKPLIDRIGEALKDNPGQVLISGHTDSQPIRSLKFPSNWHLSQARANAVKTQLQAQVKPERMRADGRADGEPVDSNETAAGRARNRRVEIILLVPAAS